MINCLKNAMDLEIHQTTPKGCLEMYKVFSSFSSSFLYLSQKCLPFILLDAFSGVLNATRQVTNVLRGRELLGLWSCWNEWLPQGDIRFPVESTRSQKGSFQKQAKNLKGKFCTCWKCSPGGTSGQMTQQPIPLHSFLTVTLRKVLKLLAPLFTDKTT